MSRDAASSRLPAAPGRYETHDDLSPSRIVPAGPVLDLSATHGRKAS